MSTNSYSENICPIARSVAFLGDAWTMLILRDANSGMTRFDQFRKSLGIAPHHADQTAGDVDRGESA
ncbi:Uncharacterised protein [Serratia plymuthica]|nr:Uncharacterised protein [Serratia plymuthica]